MNVEQIRIDVASEHAVHQRVRGVPVAERRVKINPPRFAPAGVQSFVFFLVGATFVERFFHRRRVVRRIEHVPFVSGKKPVKMAHVAMPGLAFFEIFAPFEHASVGAEFRRGNLRERFFRGSVSFSVAFPELVAGENIIAQRFAPEQLVVRRSRGNVSRVARSRRVRVEKSRFRRNGGTGDEFTRIFRIRLKPRQNKFRVRFQKRERGGEACFVIIKSIRVNEMCANPRAVHQACRPFGVISRKIRFAEAIRVMPEAKSLVPDFLRKSFAARFEFQNKIRERAVKLTQAGRCRAPIIHFAIDVEKITAHPRRVQMRIPQTLQAAWERARARIRNQAKAPELEKLFEQIGIARVGILLHTRNAFPRSHRADFRSGIAQIDDATIHALGKIFSRCIAQFFPIRNSGNGFECTRCRSPEPLALRGNVDVVVIGRRRGDQQNFLGTAHGNLRSRDGNFSAFGKKTQVVFKTRSAVSALSVNTKNGFAQGFDFRVFVGMAKRKIRIDAGGNVAFREIRDEIRLRTREQFRTQFFPVFKNDFRARDAVLQIQFAAVIFLRGNV